MDMASLVATKRNPKIPALAPGDTVKVSARIVEAGKERIQVFQGVIIKVRGGGNASFTVRHVAFGIGVERTFLLHSPLVEKVEVVRHGKVRRSRLYYLRNLSGKEARRKIKRVDRKVEKLGEEVMDTEPEEVVEPIMEEAPEGEAVQEEEAVAEAPVAEEEKAAEAAPEGEPAEEEAVAEAPVVEEEKAAEAAPEDEPAQDEAVAEAPAAETVAEEPVAGEPVAEEEKTPEAATAPEPEEDKQPEAETS